MKETKLYSMLEYCKKIKEYIELYSSNEINVSIYGDSIQKLKVLIKSPTMDERIYYISLAELIGSTTRVIRANKDEIPFLNWIGDENESFTRQYFENTMKDFWKELFEE